MAFDAFLKLGGNISGESTDDKHKEWIEILSFSHSITQPTSGTVSGSGGRSAERCDHADFQVSKYMCKADPKLALACSNGEHIPEVTLELCRATGDKQKYMEYKLEDVIVTSVSPGGAAASGESLPMTNLSLGYGKVTFTYTELDSATGSPKGDVVTYWNLKDNTGG
jgi:type VI secretion system secreted protein Hcp